MGLGACHAGADRQRVGAGAILDGQHNNLGKIAHGRALIITHALAQQSNLFGNPVPPAY